VCTGTLVHYTQTVRSSRQGTSGQAREEDAASVRGYTGTLYASCQIELEGEPVQWPASCLSFTLTITLPQRRKLKLKAKFEGGSSYFSFKRETKRGQPGVGCSGAS